MRCYILDHDYEPAADVIAAYRFSVYISRYIAFIYVPRNLTDCAALHSLYRCIFFDGMQSTYLHVGLITFEEYIFYCNLFARLCVYNSVIGYGRKSMEEYGVE